MGGDRRVAFAEIAERTEGWPAGVYLAALAALARDDGEPVTAFRGSDRFVSDDTKMDIEQDLSVERHDLLEALRAHRQFLRQTCDGLDEHHARQRLTVSELTLGGLIKHVANTERG